MNSQRFIEQNQPTWDRLTTILDKINKQGLDRLSGEELESIGPLYRRASSHLAFAQTTFADSSIVPYLNQLVARAHSYLYRTETFSARRMGHFFLYGFPLLVRENLFYLGLSALFLLGSVLLGALSHRYAPALAQLVVAPEAEKILQESIKAGQVGADFAKSMRPAISSFIMTNNIAVSFTALVLGITWGLGTAFILITNGMLLGILADIFAKNHLNLQFWSLILPHGVLELSAIIIAGGAGFKIAGALVKPGDYSRADALRLKAGVALQLALGCIPILVVAALIEGFFTPAAVSPILKLVFAAFSGIVLLFYFYHGGAAWMK